MGASVCTECHTYLTSDPDRICYRCKDRVLEKLDNKKKEEMARSREEWQAWIEMGSDLEG